MYYELIIKNILHDIPNVILPFNIQNDFFTKKNILNDPLQKHMLRVKMMACICLFWKHEIQMESLEWLIVAQIMNMKKKRKALLELFRREVVGNCIRKKVLFLADMNWSIFSFIE